MFFVGLLKREGEKPKGRGITWEIVWLRGVLKITLQKLGEKTSKTVHG